MKEKLTEEEYLKILPKKQVGTAVLFFNSIGELLILKPNYKEGWLVPGGTTDKGESPLQCALRETKEEIGLDIPNMQLVGIYHSPKTRKGVEFDSLKFVFNGGVLTDNQISQIEMQTEEFDEYTFKNPAEAISILSLSLQKSVPKCLKAIKENTFAYIDSDL